LKYYLTTILAAITISWASCCKKEACLEIAGVPITFYGYHAEDLDTIYTTGYEPGSNFSIVTRDTLMDTVQYSYGSETVFALKSRNEGGTTAGSLPGSALDATHEWRIYIPATDQTIRIYKYGYHHYTCHSCGSSKGEEKKSLSTCYINGTLVKVDAVMIYR